MELQEEERGGGAYSFRYQRAAAVPVPVPVPVLVLVLVLVFVCKMEPPCSHEGGTVVHDPRTLKLPLSLLWQRVPAPTRRRRSTPARAPAPEPLPRCSTPHAPRAPHGHAESHWRSKSRAGLCVGNGGFCGLATHVRVLRVRAGSSDAAPSLVFLDDGAAGVSSLIYSTHLIYSTRPYWGDGLQPPSATLLAGPWHMARPLDRMSQPATYSNTCFAA